MMKKLKYLIYSVLLTSTLFGQNKPAAQFAVELDPAPFILKGYSISLKYSPKQAPHLAFMASIYKSEFPDKMMSKTNRDNGWRDMKIEKSYAAFAEYYLNKEIKGFYFGPAIFWYNKSVASELMQERVEFSTIYPNARVGYLWYPFKRSCLYVNPWINMGSEINLDNKNLLNGTQFEPNKFNYIFALHIGLRLSRICKGQ